MSNICYVYNYILGGKIFRFGILKEGYGFFFVKLNLWKWVVNIEWMLFKVNFYLCKNLVIIILDYIMEKCILCFV